MRGFKGGIVEGGLGLTMLGRRGNLVFGLGGFDASDLTETIGLALAAFILRKESATWLFMSMITS